MTVSEWETANPGIIATVTTNRCTLSTFYGNGRATVSAFQSGQTGSLTDAQLMARLDGLLPALETERNTAMSAVRTRERNKLLDRMKLAVTYVRSLGLDPAAMPTRANWPAVRISKPQLRDISSLIDQAYTSSGLQGIFIPAVGGEMYGWEADPCSEENHPGIFVSVADTEA